MKQKIDRIRLVVSGFVNKDTYFRLASDSRSL